MSTQFSQVVATRQDAHQAISNAYSVAKALLADGKRVQISISEDCDPMTVKQRRFFHGPVLTQISEQVRVKGKRYVMDVWKEYFRKEFLGSRYEVYALPGAKRATPHSVRNSTEDLTIKQYSQYIDRVIAHAATEWNVVFQFNEWERNEILNEVLKNPRRKCGGATTC